jgi:glycopeptide antibiotics resistance protein
MWRLGATVIPVLVIGGMVVWLTLITVHRRRGADESRLAATRALLGVGVLTLLWWTLVLSNPDFPSSRALNLVPFREISRALRSPESGYGIVNLWGNIVVFVPIGILAFLSMRKASAPMVAFASGVALSAGIEAAQYAVGRSADVDDVILNTIGIALGVLSVSLTRRWRLQPLPSAPDG